MHIVFIICSLMVTVFGDHRLRLNRSISEPLHYDVELNIDVEFQSFSVRETILISILSDTEVIEINSVGLQVDWLNSVRVVSQEGDEYYPTEWIEAPGRDTIISLRFEQTFRADTNFTLFLEEVRGTFGRGLFEVVNGADEPYLLTTGSNRTNLRSVFPCYDEPGFRTTYDFTIYHTTGYTLITNTRDIFSEGPLAQRNNQTRNSFKIEQPMSTTSISFILTTMEARSSADTRVRVFHNDPRVAATLMENYHHLLLSVEHELKLPLEFPSLDIVYDPTLPEDTLTKWGVIAIGPTMRPVDDSPTHSVELKDIQKEIARSVYQMFFGQLVQPEWWTNQWFSLGLARFFSGVTKHLPFDAEKEFVVDVVQMTNRRQCPHIETWMGEGYSSIAEINSPNMFVVDKRAGTLMRLVANVMGKGNFQRAILDFLAQNRHSAVTDEKFLVHLDGYTEGVVLPRNRSLSQIIHKYAYSLPNNDFLQLHMYGGHYELRPSVSVDIPIDFMTPSIAPAMKPKFWIKVLEYNPILKIKKEPWVALNPYQYGLYTVSYSKEMWAEFAKQLMTNHTALFNRGQLITDSNKYALSLIRLEDYLDLIRYLPKETDVLIWRAARISYEETLLAMRGYEGDMAPFFSYYNSLAGDLYLQKRIGREMKDFEMTMELAKIVCSAGLSECVKDVTDYYEAALQNSGGLSGSSDFQTFIYCTLARNPDKAEVLKGHVLQLWIEDRRVNSPGRNAIRGLACSSDESSIKKFLDIAGTDLMMLDYGIELTPAERFFLLHTLIRGSGKAVVMSLDYLKENLLPIVDLVGQPLMEKLFKDFRYFIATKELVDTLEQIIETYKDQIHWRVSLAISHERAFGVGIRIGGQFSRWVEVHERDIDSAHGNAFKAFDNWTIIALILCFVVFNH